MTTATPSNSRRADTRARRPCQLEGEIHALCFHEENCCCQHTCGCLWAAAYQLAGILRLNHQRRRPGRRGDSQSVCDDDESSAQPPRRTIRQLLIRCLPKWAQSWEGSPWFPGHVLNNWCLRIGTMSTT